MTSQEPSDEATWHQWNAQDCAAKLSVDLGAGLSVEEVHARRRDAGPNRLPTPHKRSLIQLLGGQFTDFMVVVLCIAAAASGWLGEVLDSVAILVIVVLNALIGAFQEFRAERALEALAGLRARMARVVRGTETTQIDAIELVPGDLVTVEAGDQVPADLRLVEAHELQVDESLLTGESQPVAKDAAALVPQHAPVSEQFTMAFSGSLVTSGRGMGLVVRTGPEAEIGRIASLLSGAASRTPLQHRLRQFGRRLSVGVLGLCALLFGAGLAAGQPPFAMFMTAVSLAVAAIPEALPAVVTVALALGARRMVRHQALIRRLPAVEALGSVTYICADKTGTLTENHMHADRYWFGGAEHDALAAAPIGVLQCMVLCSDVSRTGDGVWVGDPTEVALVEAAQSAGFEPPAAQAEAPRISELPFDSERKRMTTVHRTADGVLACTKGAPEVVLPLCGSLQGGTPVPSDVATQIEHWADSGYRVLALATRDLGADPASLDGVEVETDLVLQGLVALMDPPRPEAAAAVASCHQAGIQTLMITGDHPGTARAIAARVGIAPADAEVLTGAELEGLGPDQWVQAVQRVRVYARVSPEQKLRILEALEAAGEYAAMTGDGVNDAPALRRAAVGVAMGNRGTDVAREAADLVLLDDNFATVVAAVRQGRRIYDNLRKFIKYTMTSNSGEIWTLVLAPLLGWPVPLLPIHILWINLVTDGLPGLTLASEPEEPGLMERPPRPPQESFFAQGQWQHMLGVGLLIGVLSLAAMSIGRAAGSENWPTMVFTVLTFSQLVHVLAIRSERASLFSIGLCSNLPLMGAVVVTVGLQLAAIYVPALSALLHTSPLAAWELSVCCTLPWTVLLVVEAEKGFRRRRRLPAGAPPSV